jgi:hypothetical protein
VLDPLLHGVHELDAEPPLLDPLLHGVVSQPAFELELDEAPEAQAQRAAALPQDRYLEAPTEAIAPRAMYDDVTPVLPGKRAEASARPAAAAPVSAPPRQETPIPLLAPAPASPKISGSFLFRLLEQAAQRDASDLHVHAGAPVKVRVCGRLEALDGTQPPTPEQTAAWIDEVLDDRQRAALADEGQLDLAFEVPGVGRVRVNASR